MMAKWIYESSVWMGVLCLCIVCVWQGLRGTVTMKVTLNKTFFWMTGYQCKHSRSPAERHSRPGCSIYKEATTIQTDTALRKQQSNKVVWCKMLHLHISSLRNKSTFLNLCSMVAGVLLCSSKNKWASSLKKKNNRDYCFSRLINHNHHDICPQVVHPESVFFFYSTFALVTQASTSFHEFK